MTNLAAAYAAWASHRKNQSPQIESFRYEMKLEFMKRYAISGGRTHSKTPTDTICFYDNANYKKGALDSAIFNSRFDKTIVYGTPDRQRVFRKFVQDANTLTAGKFKVVHYPLWKCKSLWPPERFREMRDALEDSHGTYDRELLAIL